MLRWMLRIKVLGGGCAAVVVVWVVSALVIVTAFKEYDTPQMMRVISYVPVALWFGLAFFVLGGPRVFKRRKGASASSGTHGTAGFAAGDQLKARGLLSAQGLLCGRSLERGEMIRFNEPGHLVTIAPTRAGKGVGAVIPNALTHSGSLIVIDPKGENARIAARARRELYQDVYVLDPFEVSGFPSASFNPLDFVRSGTEDAAEDADLVAEMLSETEGSKSSSSAHFEESARMLLRGVILYVAETAPAHARHLGEVRRLLTLPPDDFNEFLEEMSASDVAYGSAARSANSVLSMADREQSGVVSTVRRYTDWLESPRFVRILSRSDVSLDKIKQGKTTIFLVLPPDKLQRYRAFNRLFVGLSLSVLQRDAYEKPVGRVLFLLDEIAQLGYLSPLESAVGVAAGYGITLWQFWQDLSQLKSIYKERWESFISNAAVLQVFGVSDHGTAHYVSDLLGQATVQTVGASSGVNLGGGGIGQNDGQSVSDTGRALLTVDEVRRLDESKQLLFVRGMRPIVAAKLKYYQDRELVGLYDENPMH